MLPFRVRSGSTFVQPTTVWVRATTTGGGSEWRRLAQMSVQQGSSWVATGTSTLSTPDIVVSSGATGNPPTLTLMPPATGPASTSYRLEEYRYNSLGGNRTLHHVQAGAWGDSGVVLTVNTAPPSGTKLSYELYAIGPTGVESAPDVVRWQIGSNAVTEQQPVYGWNPVASDWLSPTTHFNLTAPAPSSSTRALTNAYDSAGNSTWYEQETISGTQNIPWGLIAEIYGDGSVPMTINMTWKGTTKRQLAEVRVVYRGMTGALNTVLHSRGRSVWELTGVPGGGAKIGFCTGVSDGPLVYTSGTITFTGLSREYSSGGVVPVKCVRSPYYGFFFTDYARAAVFDLRIKIRDWVVVGQETVVITPAVPGVTW